jgi:TPR repeat protein
MTLCMFARISSVTLLSLSLLCHVPAHAGAEGDVAALQCDQLAAAPDDKTKPAAANGLEIDKIDGVTAVGACSKAVLAFPQDVRLLFQLGRAYHAAKQPEKALPLYLAAADAGHAVAMNHAGFMYDKGLGVEADLSKAFAWYSKAAEKGVISAQRNVGIMYMYGESVPRDDAKAMEWFRKSADQGFAPAMNYVGIMHDEGRGVPENDTEAALWYGKAADLNDPDGIHNLGLLYENGDGVEKDGKRAVDLFMRAVKQNHAGAMASLGRAHEEGLGGLVADPAKALELYRKSADAGSPDGMHNLGESLVLGDASGWAEGLNWLQKALDEGSENAAFTLGKMTANGELPDSTPSKAAALFISALEGYSYVARDELIGNKGKSFKAETLDALQDALIARGGTFTKTPGRLDQGAVDYMQSILAGK